MPSDPIEPTSDAPEAPATPETPDTEPKTAPTGEPTPNATDPDVNPAPVVPPSSDTKPDVVDELAEKEEKAEHGLEEDVARASHGILTKLEGAQKHIQDLRQEGHQVEAWIVELETFLGGFVGKVKSIFNNQSAGV